MLRAIYTRRLVRECSRELRNNNNKMNRTRYIGPDGATNENRLAKRNQHCDVTKGKRKSQNSPFLLKQLLNNGISLQLH